MELYISGVFVTFHVDGRLNRKDRNLRKDRGYYECEKVRSNIDEEFTERYNLKKYLRAERWSFPNDFCFMKFKTKRPSLNVPYCLPIAPNTDAKSLIIGYPIFIAQEDFERKYRDPIKYEDVKKMMDGFDKKILSLGRADSADCEHVVLLHDCQTLGGTSGCLFVHLEDKCNEFPCFSAIHIGGDEKMNNNFTISVTQKEFLIEYARQVLAGDAEFVAKHKAMLKNLYSQSLQQVKQYVPNITTILQ